MITLDPLHPLQSAILETLAHTPGLSVPELRRSLVSVQKLKVSLPNLYRILAQLADEQVLLRDKGVFCLHAGWIRHMTSLAEAMNSAYSRPARLLEPALREHERREFQDSSLFSLDPTWFQACIEIAQQHPKEPLYIYNSHTWYVLGMQEQDQRGYTTLTAHGTPVYFLCGNDTFLDRYGLKLLTMENYYAALVPKPPFPSDGYSINVCGDYIIECQFPSIITKHFSVFFESVRSIDQFDAELFANVFRMKAKCKISVRRDSAEAQRVRNLMQPYFGRSKKASK